VFLFEVFHKAIVIKYSIVFTLCIIPEKVVKKYIIKKVSVNQII